jgi:asparagine synthase (glutamine-hydrolysing)
MFAGYDRYWCSAVNNGVSPAYSRVPASLRTAVRTALNQTIVPERIRRILSHTFFCRDSSVEDLVFNNWFGVFTPSMQADLLTSDVRAHLDSIEPYASHLVHFESAGSDNIVDRMLYVDIKTNLVELLMKQDRMSMAASLESRVPFLDRPLVEFAARTSHIANPGHFPGKRLLKNSVRNHLPAAIISRRKQGFPVPFEAWLRTDFFAAVRRLLLDDQALARRWFQRAPLESLLDDHATGRTNSSRQIWALMSLELWSRIFLDGDETWLEAPEEAWARLEGVALTPSRANQPIAAVHSF